MNKIFNDLTKYNNDEDDSKIFYYDDFLSLKFKLSSIFNIDCFRNNDLDVIKLEKNKVHFEKDIILKNISKCKILPLYIYDKVNTHLISIIIDNDKKTISLFTNSKKNKMYYKKIIELLNLDYEIIIDEKKIICDSNHSLCVPLSLLMIYSYFNKVSMNDYITYLNENSVQSSYNLINNFINYLEN